MNQTTHYKVVDTASSTYDDSRSDSDVTTQSYKPTGNETELARCVYETGSRQPCGSLKINGEIIIFRVFSP